MDRGVSEELLESIMEAAGESQSNRKAERAPSSTVEARCAAVESLLENVSRDPVFFRTISRALFTFCERGLHCEAEVLLSFNANLDYKDDLGFTALHVAVDRGDAKMVEILMTRADSASAVATWPNCDRCPLVVACLREDVECVRTMLEHGADANAVSIVGSTPLMRLVQEQKSLDVLELLLEKGADPNLLTTRGSHHLQSVLYYLIRSSLGKAGEEQRPERREYGVKAARLLLRHGFRPLCCGPAVYLDSLLELSLENFTQLFPLAALLFEKEEAFEPDHDCWSRFEVLQEALTRALRRRSEAEARPLVDKANALLDLPIVRPPLLRFTLSPDQSREGAGAESAHQGAEWAVDTVLASLQSLCRAAARRSLLPCSLEPKIQVLPIPPFIKDLLMPLNQD